MKKIVVFNQKGGTGKTTSVVNIAGCLENELRQKVLIFDCDSQMNSSKYLLTHENCEYKYSIEDYFKNNVPIENIVKRISFMLRKKTETDIYLIPAFENMENIDFEGNPYIIKEILKKQERNYSFCFFDCPPYLSNFTFEALACADYVIVPALPDTDSLGGYNLLLDTINNIRQSGTNINLKNLGIFFCNVDNRQALDKYIMQSSIENMKELVFKTNIRRSSAIGQARYYGKPISFYAENSSVGQDYFNLTKEILKRIRKEEGK